MVKYTPKQIAEFEQQIWDKSPQAYKNLVCQIGDRLHSAHSEHCEGGCPRDLPFFNKDAEEVLRLVRHFLMECHEDTPLADKYGWATRYANYLLSAGIPTKKG